MSSSIRSRANLEQGNRFFTNIATATSAAGSGHVYDITGAQVALVGTTQLNAGAGTVLLRDMGRTIRIASQGATAHAASVPISQLLRKVQIVRGGAAVQSVMSATGTTPLSNFVGLNEGVSGNAANSFETFYIQLSPASVWATVAL
jgi:hypothetical protein